MNREARPIISILIYESRQRKYKTAKEFWTLHQEQLKVSYPHYSTVETGTKLPDIRLAIAIAKTLKIEIRHICHAWAKDHMPDPQTKAFFEPTPGREEKGTPSSVMAHMDDCFVFSETHIPFLSAHKRTWDILSFVLAFGREQGPTEKQVSQALNIEANEMRVTVEWLRNQGIIVSVDGCLTTKVRFFYIPNTEAFREVRNSNFMIACEDLMRKITPQEILKKESHRSVFMRRITRLQAEQICDHIEKLVGHLGNLPDAGQEFYALAIAFGARANFKKK